MIKFKYLLSFLVSLFALPHIFGQGIVISMDQEVKIDQTRKSQAIVSVYKYAKNPFYEPYLIGIETDKQPEQFNIIFPPLSPKNDTCYAMVYFGGLNEREKLKGYEMILISNNKRNIDPCLIYIDRNHNLDLSDDGAPDTFYYNTFYKELSFTNPKNSEAKYKIRISRFDYKADFRYLNMIDEYFKSSSGGQHFAGSFFSFKEKRLNVLGGDYKVGNDSFRIAIKDANCNGLYNDENEDVIMLGNYKSEELTEELLKVSKNSKKMFFERNGKHFDVSDIHPLGKSLKITLDSDAKIKNSLKVGKKIKKFKFKKVDDKDKLVSIKKFKKKPTYIYVWNTTSPSFSTDSMILNQIQKEYGDIINIVTLNYGETPKTLLRMKKKGQVKWTVGLSTYKINKKLFIADYPTGILTRKKLKVKQVGISPAELLILLQKNSI